MKIRLLRPLLAALAALLLCSPAGAEAPKGGPPPALVQVGQVLQKRVETVVTLTGNAEAHRKITVASRVEGLAVKGEVQEGQRVKQGQVLIRLDTSRLEPQLAEAQAMLYENQVLLKQLKRDLMRQKNLLRARSVARKAYEDAQTAVDRQRAVVDQHQERVRLLQLNLAYTRIRAPRNGVVTKRLAWRGEWVTKGGPVLEMVVMDPVKVVVKVPERYLPELVEGEKSCATADALPDREYCGVIQAIIPSGDDKSRTFPVQVRIANPRDEIKPGMLMRVSLAVGREHQALLIPKDALVMAGDNLSVFAVIQGKAAPLPVKVKAAHGHLLEVTGGGLKPGLTIVTVGNERLYPGQPVQVAPAAGGSSPK